MAETTKSIRYRINISRGMQGKTSFEVTVEGVEYAEEEILAKSDSLVKKLEQRYPAPKEGG